MKKLVWIFAAFAIVGCSNANASILEEDAISSFSQSSRPSELVAPYIEEVLAEMKDDYRNAVSIHDATRDSPAYGRQFLLVDKYIEFLLPAMHETEAMLEHAKAGTLSSDEYSRYKELVSEWREKSTTVFGTVGRTL